MDVYMLWRAILWSLGLWAMVGWAMLIWRAISVAADAERHAHKYYACVIGAWLGSSGISGFLITEHAALAIAILWFGVLIAIEDWRYARRARIQLRARLDADIWFSKNEYLSDEAINKIRDIAVSTPFESEFLPRFRHAERYRLAVFARQVIFDPRVKDRPSARVHYSDGTGDVLA